MSIYDNEAVRLRWYDENIYRDNFCWLVDELGEERLIYSYKKSRPFAALVLNLNRTEQPILQSGSEGFSRILFDAIASRVDIHPCWVSYLLAHDGSILRPVYERRLLREECNESLLYEFERSHADQGSEELIFAFPEDQAALFISSAGGLKVYYHGTDEFWDQLAGDLVAHGFPVGASFP